MGRCLESRGLNRNKRRYNKRAREEALVYSRRWEVPIKETGAMVSVISAAGINRMDAAGGGRVEFL